MSDIFDHYADAIDNYMLDDWDGIDPNPFMPDIGGTPQDVAVQIGMLVRGCGLSSGSSVYVGSVPRKNGKTSRKFKTTCKNCKQTGLQWLQKDGGWRLYDKDFIVHSCYSIKKEQPLSVPTALEVFKKGNYTFALGRNDEHDWWKVSYKGNEIGRVLWNNGKWQMYAHRGVPSNVVENINSGFCRCLNET